MRYHTRDIMNPAAAPLVGICLLLLAASCKKDGPVPAYVRFEEPRVVNTSGAEVSSKITDLWVFVNDQPAGVWQPHRPIPLLGQGPSRIKIVAGVRKNGITNARIQYPFYATWEQQVELRTGQTVELDPVVHYFDGLDYWLSDFNTGHRFDTLNCTATLVLAPSDSTLVGQGANHGRIELDTEHAIYRGVNSGDAFTNVGNVAFLELDYRSDTRLLVGVRYKVSGVQHEVPYVYLHPTGTVGAALPWNKVYVDLATPWAVNGAVDKRFYLQAELEGGATQGLVELDNVKLVRH